MFIILKQKLSGIEIVVLYCEVSLAYTILLVKSVCKLYVEIFLQGIYLSQCVLNFRLQGV